MADSSQQSATGINNNNTLRLSSHIQRIENRGTEPLGVVNIRSFQPHLSRVPGWAVQRSTVVNRILKRYSSQEKTSAYSDDLVLAAPSQAIPRDETLNISTATQTATSSSIPIARAVRSESRSNNNSSPAKPSSTPVKFSSNTSTTQQLRKQGKSQPKSLLTADKSPTVPTLQHTVSPSPPSSPVTSGKFRVTRKPVPLPKPQTNTSSQSKLESVLTNQDSRKINVPQTAVSGANISESNVSRKNIAGDNISEENISEENISGDNAPQITKNQPKIAREIVSQGEISQTTASSLILPKRLQQENSLIPERSINTTNEINRKPQGESPLIQQKSTQNLNQFSDQSNFVQLAPNHTQHQANIVSKEILKHQPQQSTQSLILPKHLATNSTEDSENSSFSSQLGLENILVNQNSIKTDVAQPTVSRTNIAGNNIPQTTKNQPTPSRVIVNQGEISQTETSYLILPKRLQKENLPTADRINITKNGDIQLQGEGSLIQQKSTHNSNQNNFIQLPKNHTQYQENIVSKEILKNQPQQSTKSLILPKHLSKSSTENQSIKTDIYQSTISQTTGNQPTIAREIANQGEISQTVKPSLILPKRLQQENSPTADSVDITNTDNRKSQTKGSLIQQKLTQYSNQDNKAQILINHTQNQSKIAREIANQGEMSQTATPSLILPKRLQQENLPTADSVEITNTYNRKSQIKDSLIQQKSTQYSNQNSTQPQRTHQANIVSREILNHQPQQPTKSLVLPKHISHNSTKDSENYSSSSQLGLEKFLDNKSSIKTPISQIYTSQISQNQPTIAREIINQPEISQTTTPSLILPKSLSENSTSGPQNSIVSNSNKLPTTTLQPKVVHESSLKTPSVTITQNIKPLQVISRTTSPKEITSEIPSPVNLLNQQNMVWRKSVSQALSENLLNQVRNSNNQPGMPLTINSVRGEQYITRKISTTSSPDSMVNAQNNYSKHITNGETPAQTNTKTNEISVEQIAQQVSRILHRNLSIERERRGMNLWY